MYTLGGEEVAIKRWNTGQFGFCGEQTFRDLCGGLNVWLRRANEEELAAGSEWWRALGWQPTCFIHQDCSVAEKHGADRLGRIGNVVQVLQQPVQFVLRSSSAEDILF